MHTAHPVADLFPMLSEDELQELAEDIKQRGLLHPIALDTEGRILDGRNRLAACRLVDVEPDFVTYEGDDPDGYALAVNIARRHMSSSQRAITIARAVRLAGISQREGATRFKLNQGRIGQASTVLEHAPDLADAVASGATALDEAYRVARDRKTAADSTEAQLARLRSEDPELADLVVEGSLTLTGAWAERRARAEEEARQRRVATQLMCETIVAVAQMRGDSPARRYDPAAASPGRAVTRQILTDARGALDEMLQVWEERDLP